MAKASARMGWRCIVVVVCNGLDCRCSEVDNEIEGIYVGCERYLYFVAGIEMPGLMLLCVKASLILTRSRR
jgi:hypothetical protein